MNTEMTADEIATLRKAIEVEAKRRFYEGGGKKAGRKIRDIAIELTLAGWRPEDPATVFARRAYFERYGDIATDPEGIERGDYDYLGEIVLMIKAFNAGVEHGKAL